MMVHLRLVSSAVVLIGLIAACANGLGPVDVAGSYTLRTVNGTPVPLSGVHEQVSGTLTLTSTSLASRRVRYRVDAAGTVREFVATGTFRLRGLTLELALREGDYVWRPHAELVGETITLRYPHPADGPDIIEVYERDK